MKNSSGALKVLYNNKVLFNLTVGVNNIDAAYALINQVFFFKLNNKGDLNKLTALYKFPGDNYYLELPYGGPEINKESWSPSAKVINNNKKYMKANNLSYINP